jgi:hypothetical protein
MSFRPRNKPAEKTTPVNAMFGTADIVEFKTGLVFDNSEAAKMQSSSDVTDIRQHVTDTTLKASVEDKGNKYLSAPSVDDVQNTVRQLVKKHLDREMVQNNASFTKLDIENTIKSVLDKQLSSANLTATKDTSPQLSRANVEEAVTRALKLHVPQAVTSLEKTPDPIRPNFTRDSVEKAVRSVLTQHMPQAVPSTQHMPRAVPSARTSRTPLSRDSVEKAVRSAMTEHMPQAAPSTQTSRISVSHNDVKNAVRKAVAEHMVMDPETERIDASHDRVVSAVRKAVSETVNTGLNTSASRGNQMRDVLY